MSKKLAPVAKRVNVDIDANLWHTVGVFAAQTQQTKREITEAALRHWLKIKQKDIPAEPVPGQVDIYDI